MKTYLKALVLGASLSFAATVSVAQGMGLQVTKMPVGLKIYYEASNGEKRVSTFLGKLGKYYEFSIEVSGRKGGNFVARDKYDAQGRQVRWVGNGNYREKWRPYNCYSTLGECQHKRNDQYGNGRTWIHSAKREGNQVTALRRNKSEKRWRTPRYFTLGQYNIKMREQYRTKSGGTFWRKVTKIEQP